MIVKEVKYHLIQIILSALAWFLSVNALTEEVMHQVDVDDHDGNYGKYMTPYLLCIII